MIKQNQKIQKIGQILMKLFHLHFNVEILLVLQKNYV